MMVDIRPGSEAQLLQKQEQGKHPAIKVTGMPGKHVPPGVLGAMNDFLQAVSIVIRRK